MQGFLRWFGFSTVIGEQCVRRLNAGQWKREDASKLKPAAIIPVINGFNMKLAW